MSPNITSRSLPEGVLWQCDGKALKAKVTVGGGLSLAMISEVDGCGARIVDVPAEAVAGLAAFVLVTPEVAAALETVAGIAALRRFEMDSLTILHDDPEAKSASVQASVDVNADWTHFRDRRFFGTTWQEALRAAVAARELTLREVERMGTPAGITEDIHEALLAASGQSNGGN